MTEYHYSIHTLFIFLIVLIALSTFFSLAEAAMLSINRYRLSHLVRQNNKFAFHVQRLLERPDRLLGVILLCDTFADIMASAIATIIAIHYLGGKGVLLATISLTSLVLIFGEIAPKTLATIYPQQIAFIAVWPLMILLRITYPVVWVANMIANGILRLFGVKVKKKSAEHLSHDELVTLLKESGSKIPTDYLSMLLRILDLEKVTVEDIMISRNEIVGIDLSEDLEKIVQQLTTAVHIRLPVFNEDIDQVVGFLHLRSVLNLIAQNKLTKDTILEKLQDPYYIPEGTELNVQLANFRHAKRRSGLVVNEYGEIIGLVTLEDILEEIVGDFTTNIASTISRRLIERSDGSYLVDGSISVRDLNRLLHIHLPTDGPKTLSGLIIEYLETIPQSQLAIKIGEERLEVIEIQDNMVKRVRILPPFIAKLNDSADE